MWSGRWGGLIMTFRLRGHAALARLLQKLAPETKTTRLPTLMRFKGCTASLLKEADQSLYPDGTSVTRVKYDDRYAVALPFTSVYNYLSNVV